MNLPASDVIGIYLTGLFTGAGIAHLVHWKLREIRSPRCGSCLGSGEVRVLVRGGTNDESESVQCWTCKGTGREPPTEEGRGKPQ